MTIDWAVVLFEVINFGVLVAILSRFLFRPIREALDRRKEEIESRDLAMTRREEKVEGLEHDLQSELKKIDKTASRKIAEALADARSQAKVIIEDGRSKARRVIETAEGEIAETRDRQLRRVRDDLFMLATDAANRLVAQVGGDAVTRAFARHAGHALAEALERGDAFGRIVVEHSEDADPAEIREIVQSSAGQTLSLELKPDPELVAGVRILAGPHVIEASARQSLTDWYEQRLAVLGGTTESARDLGLMAGQ